MRKTEWWLRRELKRSSSSTFCTVIWSFISFVSCSSISCSFISYSFFSSLLVSVEADDGGRMEDSILLGRRSARAGIGFLHKAALQRCFCFLRLCCPFWLPRQRKGADFLYQAM
jgi:hypothetical protein